MPLRRNPVQSFIRNFIRLIIVIPLWLWLAMPRFLDFFTDAGENTTSIVIGGIITLVILWFAGIIAGMFYILPQWERLVLLRLGKSVGARGPGVFIVPPFIYSVARIVDVRITTYEVKATKTLTRDNIPIDVTAAVELEVENPEKATIDVKKETRGVVGGGAQREYTAEEKQACSLDAMMNGGECEACQ